jgi:biopolymer transport protein TolQ
MTNQPFVQIVIDSGFFAGLILFVLGIMSFLVWGIIIVRFLSYRKNLAANQEFSGRFARVEHFIQLKGLARTSGESSLKILTNEVLQEAQKFSAFVSYDSIQHRASLLEDTIQRSIEFIRLEEDRFLGFLALSTNLSPFLGLLGTVWGIMTSFYEIGQQGSADLAVVAPGIAAALVTTIGGLLVAIPASAAYNVFADKNHKNEISYYNFGSRVLSLFKRGDLLALEEVAG